MNPPPPLPANKCEKRHHKPERAPREDDRASQITALRRAHHGQLLVVLRHEREQGANISHGRHRVAAKPCARTRKAVLRKGIVQCLVEWTPRPHRLLRGTGRHLLLLWAAR